jgi:phage shock protein PspC (stress-responsive transcriptional regulator)
MARRLYRSRKQRMLGGVCGGVAEYFNLDPTVVRLIWAFLALFPGTMPVGLFGYLLCWLIIPEEPAS